MECLENSAARHLAWVHCIVAQAILRTRRWAPDAAFQNAIFLTGRHCAPKCERRNFGTVISDGRPGFFMISSAEEKASFFGCPVSRNYVFYTAPKKRTLAKTLQMRRVTKLVLFLSLGNGHLQHAPAGWDKNSHFRYHSYLITSCVFLRDSVSFKKREYLFSLIPVQLIRPIMMMIIYLRVTSSLRISMYVSCPLVAIPHICTYTNTIKCQHCFLASKMQIDGASWLLFIVKRRAIHILL